MTAKETKIRQKSSPALRILQVIPDLDTGGAERTTIDIATAVQKAGGLAVVASAGGRLESELAAVGAVLERLPMQSKNPVIMWRNAGKLREAIDRHQIKLVHARSRAPAWSAFYAARQTGIPFVATYHGTYSATSAIKRQYNSIMTKGVKTIANSQFIAEHVKNEHDLSADQIVTIPRGTDFSNLTPDQTDPARMAALRRDWGLAEDTRHILLLPGRLTRWKGQTVMIEAVARLVAMGQKNFVCVLAGDAQGRNEFEEELRKLIADLDVTGFVRIVGHISDMQSAYGLASIVISASTRPEAFGRIAVEAQAMRVPVIVTDHGGARETVLNGQTGWRVPPGDSSALAGAIDATLAMSRDAAEKMGQLGRDHVLKNYSVNQMCAKTLALYRQILAD